MANQTPPPPSVLREFCPLYYLLNAIPAKVQKGFRSVVVYLTALDVTPDYIAVGSSIGMLYLYCRRLSTMNKYNLEGKCEAITAVKLLSCFDDLVAVGTASGRVALFQLVSQLPGRNKQLRRFDVVGIHKSTVTSLAWSTNGMKLFSGDDKGKVVFSSLDLDQGVCNPVLLLEEPSGVVQLEYSQKVLLVSTQQRSLLFFTQEHTQQQIGTKPRKSSGRFGVCFLPGLCKQSDLQVFAARPGLRLWRTDISGLVEDTRLLKPLFNMEVPQVELFPRPGPVGGYRPRERQLGLLSCFLRDGWLLSWNEYSVYVLDCVNQVIIGALESCGDIVSVSCCENEIFILKGDRDIVRISNSPEGLASNLTDLSLRLSSPSTPTLLPPTGSVETAQPIRTMAIIVEQGVGGRRVVEGEEEDEDEEEDEEGPVEEVEEAGEEEDEQVEASERLYHRPSLATTDSRSRSSSVTSWDSVHGNALMTTSSTTEQSEMTASRYSAPLGHEELQQELVVKAIKVRKKAKRRRQDSSSGNRLSESSWSESNFGLQDGGCYSDGGCSGGTPLSDQTLSDLHGQDSPDLDQNRNQDRSDQQVLDRPAESTDLDRQSSETPPPSLPLHLSSDPMADSRAEPPTPDVDLLLECTFSYMHNSEETHDGQDLQPMEEQEDEFLSPLIGPEEEDEDEDMVPPSGVADQMFYSTVSCLDRRPSSVSSDEEDIYGHAAVPTSGSVGDGLSSLSLQTDRQTDEDKTRHKADQLAESWMGYSGPGCGILSLQVTDRYVWCLDFKGGLFCSSLSDGGLNWQRFEDNVHQMALSPSGLLLWKVEQRSMTAFACGKVTIKGKRHWYKAMEHTAFVALSDDTAWIVRTNGDLYLQTGLSVDRPCARSVKVECPCAFSQVCAVGGVVWALSEQRAVFYREGLTSYCSEGEMWKYDKISEAQGLEPICISLGENETAWALDTSGSLWFRTGISPIKPQGQDDHWWQVSITDYVVFDQGSLFQTLLAATQSVATVTRAPVERVAECLRVAFLSQHAQCQPSLLATNSTGVWIASGRNHLHVAKGNLIGTFWQNVVPRGTVSATRWVFITSSSVPHKEGTFLWLAQSRKDLFCVWDLDGQLRPTTVQLPPEVELVQLASCADALWGLDTHGRVHIRTLSPTCPTGLQWTLLDLNQLGPVRLVSLSCGSQNVWAVDAHGMVYFRVGTQPFNPSMMLPAWICIEPPEQPVGIHFVSVHTSPNDRLLWGVDNRGSVYVRTAISDEMPVGTDWEHVPGLSASQLVVSVRTVWVRCPSGEIARRYGITDKNPAGDYWKKIPGTAHWLTVTPDDELWAVTVSGGLSHRLTKSLPHTAKPLPSTSSLSADDFDDEWEVI